MVTLMTEYPEKSDSSIAERYSCITELTRPLVEELIDRIDIYASDRVEIKWKYGAFITGKEQEKILK